MATDFTQDTLLHYLQSCGGQVKNSDLLLHFRNFIRDHADRNRNRELFKKFVNSVATVKQIDGVSYVVLRKKFKGHVPGGGEGGSSEPPRKTSESSPENARLSPAWSAEKPREKPRQREVTVPAPPGGTAGKTVLPAAGILLLNNNNNNVETNLNLKRKPVISTPGLSGRPAPVVSQTPSPSEPPAPHQSTKVGQHRVGPAVRPHGETSQKVPVPGLPPAVRPSQTSQQVPVPVPVPGLPPAVRPSQQVPVPVPVLGLPRTHGETSQKVPVSGLPPAVRPSQQVPVPVPVLGLPRTHGETSQKVPVPGLPPAVRPSQTSQQVPVPVPGLPPAVRPSQQVPVPVPVLGLPRTHGETSQKVPVSGLPPAVRPSQTSRQVPVPEPLIGREAGLHQEPPLHHQAQIAPRRMRHRPSYKSAVSYDDDEEEEDEVQMRRGSAGGAWPQSTPLRDTGRVISASSPCIVDQPVVSSPSSPSERKLPRIYVQDVEGRTQPPGGPGWRLEMGAGFEPRTVPEESTRRSLPLEAERYIASPHRATEVAPHRDVHADRRHSQPAGVQLDHRKGSNQSQGARPSSSHSGTVSPSSDAGTSTSGSPRGSGWNSRSDDLQTRAGHTEGGSQIQEVLQRAQGKKLEPVTHHANSKTTAPFHHSTGNLHDNQEPTARLSPLHHSTDRLHVDQSSKVMPWHLSTGDLYDNREEAESSDGSTSSPRLRTPAARRVSSQLRSRMCRSLGTDIDQLLQEEARAGGGSEAARLNRLHMISSSLSLRYNVSSSSLSSCSTPPRCHSFTDLNEMVEGRGGTRSSPATADATAPSSPAHHEGPSRQSLVPLEPREHAWLVKGAAGAWPDIYTLFREDSSLLNRQDFISGFTVLHWIAKHGDHRVLNTLWYGVQKAGLTFDVNAKSTCGHTPLHIAAMHGNKNIMRLLVNKFKADVKLRDTAGKKPWQYLSRATASDVFQLLEAPPRLTGKGEGGVGTEDPSLEPRQQQQRRRRRHHLSFASSSGERPRTMSGTTRVKRSSSIAAFLKHKSMLRFGHLSSEFSV